MDNQAAIESACGIPKGVRRNLDRYAVDMGFSMSPPSADDGFLAFQAPWRSQRSKLESLDQNPTGTTTNTAPPSPSPSVARSPVTRALITEDTLPRAPSLESIPGALAQFLNKDCRPGTSLPDTPFATPPTTPSATPQSSPLIQRKEFGKDPSKNLLQRFYFPAIRQTAGKLHSVSEDADSEVQKPDLNIVTSEGIKAQRLRSAPTGSLLDAAERESFSKESSPELPISPGSAENRSHQFSDGIVGRPRLGSAPKSYFYMGLANINENVKDLVDRKLELIKQEDVKDSKPPLPPIKAKPISEPAPPPKRPPRIIPKKTQLREMNMFAPGGGF